MPRMQPVTSSWIASVGYGADAQAIYVELIEGVTYVYEQVPQVIWQAFAAADSKGHFVNAVLKPYFPCREL